MNRQAFLQRTKERLTSAFRDRFKGIVLFGSEAREEAEGDSDIDLLVLLRGPVDPWVDRRTIIRSLYDLQLEIVRPIHATPVDAEAFEAGNFALFRNAKREGVFA